MAGCVLTFMNVENTKKCLFDCFHFNLLSVDALYNLSDKNSCLNCTSDDIKKVLACMKDFQIFIKGDIYVIDDLLMSVETYSPT